MHRMLLRHFIAPTLMALVVCCPLNARQIPNPVNKGPVYEVDLSDAINHYVTVSLTANPVGEQTTLMMPVWTPGSYLVREYAKHIDRISAENDSGKLSIVKTKKNRWQVDTPDGKPFTVTYRIFCKEISVRTNYVDRSYAVLIGAATYITIPEQLDTPHEVRLVLPDVWKKSATSLRLVDEQENHYLAENYDELVDSPIVAGHVEIFPFEVADVPHFLVNVNDEGSWNGEKAAKDLAKVVKAHHDLWGVVPYDRYYFLNVINNSGGGLEHNNSCLMMTSQTSFRDGNSYNNWLGLCSHEFFHTWNIRRVRPKSLVHYDYESEVYTPSLWVAEGVTSYYEDLLLVRAGLMKQDAFVKGISGLIRRVEARDGRKVQSLRDSSHDAWIKFYRPAENSRATQVSYYTKGSLAGFLLDIEIRKSSHGEKSLDDALRELYASHAGNIGYDPEDFRSICNRVAGADLGYWFDTTIDSTDDLAYQNVADWLGADVGSIQPFNARKSDEDDDPPKSTPWIGIGKPDSPATLAGVDDTDEILAVEGERIGRNVDTLIRKYDEGDEITLLLSRDDQIVETKLTVGGIPPKPKWDLKLWSGANPQQRVNRTNWMLAKNDSPAGPPVYKWTKKKKLVLQ